MKIQKLMLEARKNNNALFIPYITCGDPSLTDTADILRGLVEAGADIIELGVPFSDPIADGPTNQLAAMRALRNKVSLRECCQLVSQIRNEKITTPIVLFTYLNPILRLGVTAFAKLAKESGVDAVLIVDSPMEESNELFSHLSFHGIGNIKLITPTTSVARIKLCHPENTEFLYYVSRKGVTGAQNELSHSLKVEIDQVKQHSALPIAVGFGISTPVQAAEVARMADGVIIGSALVKQLESTSMAIGKTQLLNLAKELNQAIKMKVGK